MVFFKKLRRLASLTRIISETAEGERKEEWIEAKDAKSGSAEASVVDVAAGDGHEARETVFELKYLGSRFVESPNNEDETAEAIKTVSSMAKANGKKVQRVALAVSLQGVRMTNLATDEEKLQVSIYRISQCPAEGQAFAFVATNLNETMECHVFACPKRRIAREAALVLGRAFDTAYELWQMDNADSKMYHHASETLQFIFDDFPPGINETLASDKSGSSDGSNNKENEKNNTLNLTSVDDYRIPLI